MRFQMQLHDPFNPGIAIDMADQFKADAFVRMLRSSHLEARTTNNRIRDGQDVLLCNNYSRSPFTLRHRVTVINKSTV